MNRRNFLIGSAGLMNCVPVVAQSRKNPDDPNNPYLEDQHPASERGKALADFARSLKIQRAIPFVKRKEGELTLSVYQQEKRSPRPIPCILTFGFSAFRLNSTNYRWDLENLPPSPTSNLYPPALARDRVVVVANLRTSSQAMWPAPVHDAKCAMRWIRKNAAMLNIDPERIGLFGASASGNIAALVALTAAKGQLEDPDGDPTIPTRARAVCALSTPTDWVYYKNVDPGDKSLFVDVLPPYLGNDDHLYREASPVTYVHDGAPPFFLSHGIQDRRVPYSQMARFAEAMGKRAVVETLSINNFQHGPIPGKQPDPDYPVTDGKISSFLERYLDKGAGGTVKPG